MAGKPGSKGANSTLVVGARFGRLEIVGEPFLKEYGNYGPRRICPCRCDCGAETEVWANRLLSGYAQSCGCLQKERRSEVNIKHGGRRSRLYSVWTAMKGRCRNPNDGFYKDYGGRGIAVCDEWVADFAAFRSWAIAHGYRPGLSIERKNVNGNYEPGNCEWIPMAQQARNRTDNRWVAAFGEKKILEDWARDPRCQVVRMTLLTRLNSGWEPETAISKPARKCANRNARLPAKIADI